MPPSSGFGYYLRRLGPGLVTGAANDDPGAIGTHAQVGAQFGAASYWLAPYTLPLTAVVLEMCAQIGNVTGRGLVTIVRFRYALGEALGWKRGLGREALRAPKLYGAIVGCIMLAVLGNLLGVNPIRALVLSQVLNGVVAIPLVLLILLLCNDRRVMGDKTSADGHRLGASGGAPRTAVHRAPRAPYRSPRPATE